MDKRKEEAYQALSKAHYKRELATFNFEMFTGILTRAYNDLDRYKEPVQETKKVRLLEAISDPKLEAAKQAVKSNPEYNSDFHKAINFISQSVVPLNRTNTRNISETQTEISQQGGCTHTPRGGHSNHGGCQGGRSNYQHGGRGRGGGDTRGRYSSRGGRSYGGHNRGRGGCYTSSYIPPDVWNSISYDEQRQHLQARGTFRGGGGRNDNEIHTNTPPDQVSVITEPTQANQTQVQQDQVSQVTQNSTSSAAGGFAGHSAYNHGG